MTQLDQSRLLILSDERTILTEEDNHVLRMLGT